MAWEWVAPTATAMVGVAGMWFTYRTGKKAREAQAESEKRTLAEARHRDLTTLRQDVYGRFIAAVKELEIDTEMQGAVDRNLGRGPRSQRVDAAMTVVEFPEMARRLSVAIALSEQVTLLCDETVETATLEVTARLPSALALRPTSDPDNQRRISELPVYIARLTRAMANEIRS